MEEKSSDVSKLATQMANKNPLVLKIKIIIGVIIAVFLILVAILNYGGGKSDNLNSFNISSDSFTCTQITSQDYIYDYKSSIESETDCIYFLLDCETGENVTLTIEIYSYDGSFEIPVDEESNLTIPDFASFENKFSKTIDFIHEDTDGLSEDEINELADKYKHSLKLSFEPSKTIIVYIKSEESFEINKLSFIFEKSVE